MNKNAPTFMLILIICALLLSIWGAFWNFEMPFWGMLSIAVLIFVVLKVSANIGNKLRKGISSLRLWQAKMLLLLFMSGLVFRLRSTQQAIENPVDFWTAYRLLLMGIIGLFLLLKVNKVNFLKALNSPAGFFLIYTILELFSSSWSVYPVWTFVRSLEDIIKALIVIGTVFTHPAPSASMVKKILDSIWLLFGVLLVNVFLQGLVFPDMAWNRVGLIGYQLKGIYPHIAANGVGHIAALIGVVAFSRFLTRGHKDKFYLIMLLFSIGILIFSQSRSPIFGFLLAVLVVLFYNKRSKYIFLLLLLIAVFSTSSVADLLWKYLSRGETIEQMETLSDRLTYLQLAMPYIKERPLTGFGAHAGGRFIVVKDINPLLNSLHGTWQEVIIGVGILGFLPLFFSVVGAWKALLIKAPLDQRVRQLHSEILGVLTLITFRSLFAETFIAHPGIEWEVVLVYVSWLGLLKSNIVMEGARNRYQRLSGKILPSPDRG